MTSAGATAAPPLLFQRAELDGARLADVRVAAGVVAEISPARLRPRAGETVVDAAGGALLPGLHDHHVHLMALAASTASVRVGPPDVQDRAALRRALTDAPGGVEWIRAVGYHPAVAGDLDRAALDALGPDRPIRLQYRTGSLWVLNSAGLRLAGVDRCDRPGVERDAAGRPTGRLWRMDNWLRENVPAVAIDLAGLGRAAAAAGVVGFTDATPARAVGEQATLAAAVATGLLPQRLTLMLGEGPPPPNDDGGPTGNPTGNPTDDPTRAAIACGRLAWGPVKIMLDDPTLPAPAALADRFRAAHRAGRAVAVHCVTRVQLVVTLAAFTEAGSVSGDRIEHAAVVPPALRGTVRELGLIVVTQPNFVAERGDRYLADVDDEDPATLYPARSLLDAGIGLAAGTDAPFGRPDPWAAIAAAIARRTAAGTVLGPGERLDPGRALELFLGPATAAHRPRTVRPGLPADLCLLRLPRDAALDEPSADHVTMTVIGGVVGYAADQAS